MSPDGVSDYLVLSALSQNQTIREDRAEIQANSIVMACNMECIYFKISLFYTNTMCLYSEQLQKLCDFRAASVEAASNNDGWSCRLAAYRLHYCNISLRLDTTFTRFLHLCRCAYFSHLTKDWKMLKIDRETWSKHLKTCT